MKYLCMAFRDEQRWNALDPLKRKALEKECAAYNEVLRKSGNCLDVKALPSAQTSATLRFDNGKMSITDGPFAETKEQLGGFMLLEAMDLNHAIQLMAQLPGMRLGGSIEIRPVSQESGEQECAQ